MGRRTDVLLLLCVLVPAVPGYVCIIVFIIPTVRALL